MERIKRAKNCNYTTISNVFLRDKNLSLDAKGFLALVMSLPENWDFTINGMVSIVKEGRNHVYNSIKELIRLGYCKRVYLYTSSENGKKVRSGVEYLFLEEPIIDDLNPENLNLDNGDLDKNSTDLNPDYLNLGFQNFENQTQISKEHEIILESNKKRKSKDVVLPEGKTTCVLLGLDSLASIEKKIVPAESENHENIPAHFEKKDSAQSAENEKYLISEKGGRAGATEKIESDFENIKISPSARIQFSKLSKTMQNSVLAVMQTFHETIGSKSDTITNERLSCIISRLKSKIDINGVESHPTLAQFEAVFKFKYKEWAKNDKMRQYLAIETLCNGKFEKYLEQARNEFAKKKEFSTYNPNNPTPKHHRHI